MGMGVVQCQLVARVLYHIDLEFILVDARNYVTTSTIRHWLPIVTVCPVNCLPDLIYVSMVFEEFVELYAARARIRQLVSWKCMFMEDVARVIIKEFPHAKEVQVRLAFSRHIVTVRGQ